MTDSESFANSEQDLTFNLVCLQRRFARKRFRKDILEAWNNKCAYCEGERAHTLDHVIPRAKGGATKRQNLIACCPTCNLQKSDSHWFQWFRQQKFWCLEKEQKIFQWLHQDHEYNQAAKEYEDICKTALNIKLLPASGVTDCC